MKTRTAATLAAVLLAITLTGCTATADTQPKAFAAGVQETPATSESPAPLVAETPSTNDGGDAKFLSYVREHLQPSTQIPNATDDQLLSAADDACARMAAGEQTDTMSLIDGEQKDSGGYFYDSGVIITGASMFVCPA
ncbi:DUF732 domain-containing protein [Microbacterium sp.]|uniref:DUF732 domain-containing protein n=1 Tax=Microbacterium sp. TaxID=51671 RepID=UPI003A947E03